jgi:hypothetical protein
MRVTILPGSLAVLWLAAACGGGDGGGNGPAGGKDAQGTETLAEVMAEAAGGDETAPVEVQGDAQVAEVPVEAMEEPGAEVPACQNECYPMNTRECADGTSYRTCVPGNVCLAWSAPVDCGTGMECQGGECVPAAPDCSGVPNGCGDPGAKRCSGDGKAVETCNGNYECPRWELSQACTDGQTCADGACTGGGANCATLDACVAANCAAEAATGSEIKKTNCSLKNCRADYEACYGAFGDKTCKDLLKCAQACQTPECQNGCMSSASYEANLEFLDMGICMEDNCPDALEDPMANIGCITGTCGAPLNKCCGGSLMNCM